MERVIVVILLRKTVGSLFRGFLILGLAALSAGCGRAEPEAPQAAGPPPPEAAGAADPVDPAGTTGPAVPNEPEVKDLGFGLKPQRSDVADNPAGWPPVELEPATLDFGVLGPGETARGTSRIWNVGSSPLTIIKSITSCGCTAAENLDGRVIPPGGHTEFTTDMTMKSGLGEKMEKISIIFEGYTRTFVVQYFTAEVSLPIRLVPPHLPASRRDPDGGWINTSSGEIQVESTDGKPFRILRVQGEAPEYVGFDPATDEPRSEYTLRWNLQRFGDRIPWFWVVETDRPDAPLVDARVQHVSTLVPRVPDRHWQPKDLRILVGIVRAGEPFEISTGIECDPGTFPDPASAAVTTASPHLQAELLETQRDGQELDYRIRITPAADVPPGLLYEVIELYAGGYGVPLRIIGRIEG
jgi:hypothetical protein